MPSNYDKIAGNYDWISRLVFQNSIVDAQRKLVGFIGPHSNVLIAGGGTGWILKEILKLHTAGIGVTYVESSAEMIRIAKERDFGSNRVSFVHADIENFTSKEQFDIIMTPFLFDNFDAEKIERVFKILDGLLVQKGMWLFADFLPDGKNRKPWQNVLVKIMYWFFKVTSHIEANRLHPTEYLFSRKNYTMISRNHHFHGFIEATVYQKS